MNCNHLFTVSAIVLFVIALGGCSGEPSSVDIEKAIKALVEQENQQLKQTAGKLGGKGAADDYLTKVHEVRKIACTAAQGSSGFNCDVEMDLSMPLAGRQKAVKQLRFVKSSDGWQVTK